MSKRKKWMLAGLLGGLVILTMGLGATAYAASSDDTATSDKDTFISKVANILGLDEDTVSDAMTQARDEMRQEAQQERLNNAVEDGVITQEEADQISAWMDARPDALDRLEGPGHGLGLDMQCPPGLVDSQDRLSKAVEDGVITQEEADQISAWMDARPDALDKLGRPGQGLGDDIQCRRGLGGGGHFGPSGPQQSLLDEA